MGEAIEVTAADGHRLAAYLVGDPTAARALVVCHDVGGLNKYIKRAAKQAAAFGFHVIVPALFDRTEQNVSLGCKAADMAHGAAIAAQVPADHQMKDIATAIARLGRAEVGIVGFGWGGTAAWLAASELTGIGAAVAFYGTGIAEARQHTPRCPTQLYFGAYDRFIPMSDVDAIRRAQPAVAIEVFPMAAHLFACDESESYEATSAESAWETMAGFLRKHL
jgi:carboxymethylenebutenolidase